MFTKIGHLLPETLQKNGMAPKVARARMFAVFEEAARRKLGADQATAFKPLHLFDGTLTVACTSSSVAVALRSAEAELLQAIADVGGEVERVRFLLAPWR